jgi:hypothetical protein
MSALGDTITFTNTSNKKFPTESGSRVNVQISSKSINNFNIKDSELDNNNGVLTLLEEKKDNNTYSLSIKIEKGFTIKDNISTKEFIYIIPSTENDVGSFIKNTENIENAEVKYILIIGKPKQEQSFLSAAASSSDKLLEAPNGSLELLHRNSNTITLDITKVFYILNNKPGVVTLDNEEKSKINDISEYEFLNLYYINYFSFDPTYFSELYNSLKSSEKSTTTLLNEAEADDAVPGDDLDAGAFDDPVLDADDELDAGNSSVFSSQTGNESRRLPETELRRDPSAGGSKLVKKKKKKSINLK